MELRDYQQDARESIQAEWDKGIKKLYSYYQQVQAKQSFLVRLLKTELKRASVFSSLPIGANSWNRQQTS